MIDWHDCIVHVRPTPSPQIRNIYIWIAYQAEKSYLPVAIGDTSEDLAREIGVSAETILACWMRYKSGKTKNTRYHRVNIGPQHHHQKVRT